MESSSAPTPVSLDGLLIHAEWVRNLARALVRDDDSASDVEQEVWREAIERPPASSSNVRGWLAQVARNAARMQVRTSHRARARETMVARHEALPSTLDVVAEAELSRSLAGRVIALAEPYRTTLLLRYFRGHTVDEIAEQHGVSRETVRTRQRRGLELLRADMDASHEGRAQWMEALLPLARLPRNPAVTSTGIVIGGVMSVVTWTVAAAVVVGVAWFAWPTGTKDVQLATRTEVPTATPDSTGDSSTRAQTSATDAKRSVAVDSSVQVPAAAAKDTTTVRAVLSDWRGVPIAHEEIEFRSKTEAVLRDGVLHTGRQSETVSSNELEMFRKFPEALDQFIASRPPAWGLREVLLGRTPERPRVFSAGDGAVNVSLLKRPEDIPKDDWEPKLVDERHTLVRGHRDGSEIEVWIVVPSVPIAGVVVDAEGNPLGSVEVDVPISLDALPDFAFASNVSYWESPPTSAMSDEQGRFAIDRAPLLPQHALQFQLRGFEGKQVDIPPGGDRGLRVQLDRVVDKSAHVRGIVLGANGTPVFQAWVQLGQDGADTDAQGRFDMKLTNTFEGSPLTATKQGALPAILPDVGRSPMHSMEDVVLRLGPAPLTISGTVVDVHGKPAANCTVQIVDGTPSGTSQAFIEDVADGRHQIGKKSDANGRFEIGGLFPHDYHLMARDGKRGLIAWSGPIAAGSKDVVLRNDPTDFSDVEGRVVTRRGVALGSADVAISVPVFHILGGTSSITYGKVKTDEAGRFHLHDVPQTKVQLSVSGDGIDYTTVDVPQTRTGVIEVTASLSVRVKLEVADSTIDRVAFLDENGKPVTALRHLQDSESSDYSVSRLKSGFPSFNLSDAAVTIVLMRGTEEVRRTPVEIRRVDVLVLSF